MSIFRPGVYVVLTIALGSVAFAADESPRPAGGSPTLVKDALAPPAGGDVKLEGHLGKRIDLCIRNRVMAQDFKTLVKPFAERKEVGNRDWRCEYWGKWYTSAVLAASYDPNPEWRTIVEKAVKALMAVQTDDGYIGTRVKEHRGKGWDVWGRKYVLLGLLAYYDLTGDKVVLEAAKRHADAVLAEIGPGNKDILSLGMWNGMAASSILEPIVVLYRRTGEKRYLDFAEYIVGRWEDRKFSERALAGGAPYHKAYEGMSCIEGLCELYRVTGEKRYLEVSIALSRYIIEKELFVSGSGSSGEKWFGGRTKQIKRIGKPMETCVMATWMKLCYQLLRLTGDPTWADEMERTTYNALLAPLKTDGSWWCYFTPLQGARRPSYITPAKGDKIVTVTDATWKSAGKVPGKWRATGFDDGTWQKADAFAAFGCAPWGKVGTGR